MRARTAVKKFGTALVGQTIRTQAIGDWRGGMAKVVELYPDKQAKEIVMQIRGTQGQGEVGVFHNEQIEIV